MSLHYDFDWHLRHRDRNAHSAKRVADLLMPLLPIRSAVDFGCGDGIWLRTLADRGVERILGYDGIWNDPGRLQIDPSVFRVADLARPVVAPCAFDLAICLEVAEHLPASASGTLVGSICNHAPAVLFGAAIPNQGGYRHINERWQSYWHDAFRERGYSRFDFIRSQIWDDPEMHFWYKQNIALYVRDERTELVARLKAAIDAKAYPPLPVDVVHPDLFNAISTYRQIAFRPLLRRLPSAALCKARDMARAGHRGVLNPLRGKGPAFGLRKAKASPASGGRGGRCGP